MTFYLTLAIQAGRNVFQIIPFDLFNLSSVKGGGKAGINRQLGQHRNLQFHRHFFQMAVPENRVLLAAIRTLKIAVILYQPKDGNIHHLGHIYSLCHDHGYQILRRSDDNNTVHGKGLENS